MNRRIFKDLSQSFAQELQSVAVYDGRRNLYAPFRLKMVEMAESASVEFDIVINDDPTALARAQAAGQKSAHNNRTFTVRIKFISAVDMKCLLEFLNGSMPSVNTAGKTTTPQTVAIKQSHLSPLQAMDVLMRHRPSMMLTTIGRSFFTRNDVRSLGDGAECWMGFHQSVRPARGKLLINIDVSATAFYEPGKPILIILI
jgi:eukaryotic translation initiation factor 2C